MTTPFEHSYLGQLRRLVGNRLLMIPGVRAVLEDSSGRILLLKRQDLNIWGLIGGSPEERESIQDCLIREIFEETGLKIESYCAFGFASDPELEVFTFPNGNVIHSYPILFHVSRWSGTLDQSNDESTELRFFVRDEIPEMLKNERATLERFWEFRRTGTFQDEYTTTQTCIKLT